MSRLALVVLVALAIGLRVYKADYTGIVFDEALSALRFGSVEAALHSYEHANNHVLNSLAIALERALFPDWAHAIRLHSVLCGAAFVLVLFTNIQTILLSFAAVALAACYPFMKRYTHLPQVVLGAAFAWGIPMAFSAQRGELPASLWLIYIAVLMWTVAYDTFYAMVDRDVDLKIGVKSTAILFGDDDKAITAMLQVSVILVMLLVGKQFAMSFIYYAGLMAASGLFIYQQKLIKYRERDKCFQAFLNNHYVGMAIFAGIALHYALPA